VGIPTIRPYPMPTERELPDNQVPWIPDASRAALLIHDMQQYFLDFFPEGRSPRVDLVANIERILRAGRRLGLPVIYTAQPGAMSRQQRGLLHDIWGPGMSDHPRHTRIVGPLAPADGELVLTKWRYSAFHRSDLAGVLRSRGRDQLIICGVYSHVGCLMTATDAFTLDIQPFLVADAMADFTRDYHRLALSYAAERCARTISTAELLTALTRPDPTAERVLGRSAVG
jgi:trans-2,3-dihydro-3-hydroxyanthranilic acid synthase